jgi:hypothetical protein
MLPWWDRPYQLMKRAQDTPPPQKTPQPRLTISNVMYAADTVCLHA